MLWEDTFDVLIMDGYFAVGLGSGAALEAQVFIGRTWLGMQPEEQAEFMPRQILGDVPTALLARDVVGPIHPESVSVGGQMVIDATGRWVEEAGLDP